MFCHDVDVVMQPLSTNLFRVPLSQNNSGELHEIKWIYPVRGYPELTSAKDIAPAVIECKARDRVEERFEVLLSGVAPSNGGPKRGLKSRAITPKGKKPKTPDNIVVGESKCDVTSALTSSNGKKETIVIERR